jgi:hypothetical protein
MFPFADVVNLLAHELAGGGRWRLSTFEVSLGSFESFSFRHDISLSNGESLISLQASCPVLERSAMCGTRWWSDASCPEAAHSSLAEIIVRDRVSGYRDGEFFRPLWTMR